MMGAQVKSMIPTNLCGVAGDAYSVRCALLAEAFDCRRDRDYAVAEREVNADYAKLSPAKFIAKYGSPQ